MAHVFAKTRHHPHMASYTSVGGCYIPSKILALSIEIWGRTYDETINEMMVCYKGKCYHVQHYLPNKPEEYIPILSLAPIKVLTIYYYCSYQFSMISKHVSCISSFRCGVYAM